MAWDEWEQLKADAAESTTVRVGGDSVETSGRPRAEMRTAHAYFAVGSIRRSTRGVGSQLVSKRAPHRISSGAGRSCVLRGQARVA